MTTETRELYMQMPDEATMKEVENAESIEEALEIGLKSEINRTMDVIEEECDLDFVIVAPVRLTPENNWVLRYCIKDRKGEPYRGEMDMGTNAGNLKANPKLLMIAMLIGVGSLPREPEHIFDIEAELSRKVIMKLFGTRFKEVVDSPDNMTFFEQIAERVPCEEHTQVLERARETVAAVEQTQKLAQAETEGSA